MKSVSTSLPSSAMQEPVATTGIGSWQDTQPGYSLRLSQEIKFYFWLVAQFCSFFENTRVFARLWISLAHMSPTSPNSTTTVTRHLFSQRLRESRVRGGFKTARSFAQALDIDENRYTRYERAEVEPDLDLLTRICEKLAVTPNDLLIDAGSRSTASATPWANVGFAEDGASPMSLAPLPITSPERLQPAAASALRRRALTWQIARTLALAEVGGRLTLAAVLPPSAATAVQRVSQIYALVERDPFWLVHALAGAVDTSRFGDAELQRLEGLLADLMQSVEDELHG